MNDCLVILNPRSIKVCLDSIEGLDIRKVFLRGWSERAIADRAWPLIMKTHLKGFDWIWIVSDDVIVRQQALDAVRRLVSQAPVITGYSQRSHTEWVVNLTREPLKGSHPHPDSYNFMEYKDVVSYPSSMIPTWFTGMSLTGMSYENWERFPFDCFYDPGYASDFHLSLRLQEAGIPIVAAREAHAYHWRTDWVSTNNPDDESPLVGIEKIVLG